MLLSIIVPVYNAEKFLPRCLDSLLNQGLGEGEMEVVCVDDGSTDGSLQILQNYAKEHACIKVFMQKNMGAGVARNKGLDNVAGEIVTFCDADDYLIPGGLGSVIRTFWSDEVDVVCHGSETLDAKKLRSWKDPYEVNGVILAEGTGRNIYERSPKYFVWNTLIRRSFLEQLHLRFLPFVMAEDASFLLELMMAEPRTRDVSSNIYRYTVSDHQITRQRNPEMMMRCVDAYLHFLSRLRYYGQSEVLKSQLVPFYSRVLSADLNREEFSRLAEKTHAMDIRIGSFFSYVPMSFLFRRFFVPFILPKIGRG